MKTDVFFRAISAGFLSAVIYAFVELLALQAGVMHTSVWKAAAGMFLPADQIATPLGTLIGLIGHLAIGGLWGIVYYVLLLYIGISRSVYKGGLVGIYLWLFGTVMMRLGVTSYVYFDITEQLGAMLGSMIFGLSLGFLLPRFALRGVSESNPIFRGSLATMIAQPAFKPAHDTDDNDTGNSKP